MQLELIIGLFDFFRYTYVDFTTEFYMSSMLIIHVSEVNNWNMLLLSDFIHTRMYVLHVDVCIFDMC